MLNDQIKGSIFDRLGELISDLFIFNYNWWVGTFFGMPRKNNNFDIV